MSIYRDRVVFLTGAASGIGLALARQLAQAGAKLVLADLRQEALEQAGASLDCAPQRVMLQVLDVTDRAGFREAAQAARERFGPIDYLFNNAGVGVGGEARDFGDAEWDRIIDVNVFGVIHGIQAIYPMMLERGQGHIVNVASVAGLVPIPGETSYTASKFAVVGLTHALRAEAADLGVKVSLVCPGVIQTPIYDTSSIIGFDAQGVLSLWPKGITAERCAAIVLKGVARNKATIVVTRFAKWLARVHRWSPSLMLWSLRQYMRRARQFRHKED